MLELGNRYLRVYKDGAQVESAGVPVEVHTPFDAADLFAIHYGQMEKVLLLVHPITLAWRYALISPRDAALLLLPGQDPPTTFGIFSLLLLIGLLVATFYVKLRYGTWKKTHQYLGLSFFLAGLHALLIPSDISRSLPLRVYILSLAAVALLVFAYRTVLGTFLVKRHRYTVKRVIALSERIAEIELAPTGTPMRFVPGQFAFVRFRSKDLSTESHPFSIASSSHDDHLRFAIHALGDGTKQMLALLTEGTTALVEGSFGQLSSRDDAEQVWIGGGVGVVPFLSMARSLKPNDAGPSITLFYSAKSERDAGLT